MNACRSLPLLILGLAFLFPAAAHADDLSPPTDPDLQPPATVPQETNARVHIKSSSPVELWRFEKSAGSWTVACAAPCDRDLPIGDEYRVVFGGGVPAGAIFHLRSSGAVTLAVERPSQAAKIGGTAVIVVGVGLAAVSLVGLIVGIGAASQPACGPQDNDWCGLGRGIGEGIALISGVGVLAGAGIIAGGAVLLSESGGGTTQKSTPSPAFVREPTWVAPRAASVGKPAFLVPLSLSF